MGIPSLLFLGDILSGSYNLFTPFLFIYIFKTIFSFYIPIPDVGGDIYCECFIVIG